MENGHLQRQINCLSPSRRKEAIDFIEFLLAQQQKETSPKTPVFGCAKGCFKIADDFDSTPKDFLGYM